jgi:DNA repair protein RecO (recombination protein O)
MTGAEVAGRPSGMTGDAMLSAFYVNELLLHFLHRFDPQPEIFALYDEVIKALVSASSITASLRSFELEFLSLLGYAVDLEHEYGGQEDLADERHYQFRMEQGAVPVERLDGPLIFSGAILKGIAAQRFEDAEVLRAANRLLRDVIGFHLGGKELKSRKVLLELHRGRIAHEKVMPDIGTDEKR